jgi:hypothetical protein
MFFLDFEGNVSDPRWPPRWISCGQALFMKVLGCYPAKATPSRPRPPGSSRAHAAPAGTGGRAASAPAVHKSKNYKLADRASQRQDTVVRVGDILIGGDGFTVMAGPCSVESSDQIYQTASYVRGHGAHVLRGGVFKPRTSPYAFQGLGYDGLDLLASAGRSAGAAHHHRGDVARAGARGGREGRTSSRSAPATCRTSRCSRRWARWTARCCSSAASPAPSRSGWPPPSTSWPRATAR